MADGLPPPPSYSSLFQGGCQTETPTAPSPQAYHPAPTADPIHLTPLGAYYQPRGPIGNYPPGQAYGPLSDPVLNPAYSSISPGSNHYNVPGGQCPPGALGNPALQEIPIVIEDRPDVPVNPKAPQQCSMGSLQDYRDLQIAPELGLGHDESVDQFSKERDVVGWCCMAFWSVGSHVCFVVCVFLLVWQVPLKQKYDEWWATASSRERILNHNKFEYNSNILICASVFLCLCWLIAVIEGCWSDTRTYIKNVTQLSDFHQKHGRLRNMVPTIVWKATAFHKSRERIEIKNGVIVSRRRSSTEHINVTYQDEIAFPFSKCVDVSGSFDNSKKGVINRIEFSKAFGFLDEASAVEYQTQKTLMIERAKSRDEHHTFEEDLVLPGYKERVTVYMEEGCHTVFMSSSFYSYLICILCTWPYRIFFRLVTTKRNYAYVKLVGI